MPYCYSNNCNFVIVTEVEPLVVLHSNGRFLTLPTIIRPLEINRRCGTSLYKISCTDERKQIL
jgi:hypothetical protein